jgi:hypothetical protein
MKENVLHYLIQSNTHYGQEARILTKYFIPDHKRIIFVQNMIEEFRENLAKRKKASIEKKFLAQRLAKKEEELDSVFLDEIARELEVLPGESFNKKF